jgi:hypothetical protein
MFRGAKWMTEWNDAEAVSLRIAEICATIPLRGSWEPDNRIAFAMASFRLTQEHHNSIHLLLGHNKFASANALARPVLEAGLRTIWIIEDASDREIDGIAKGREFPILGELNNRRPGRALTGKHQGLLHSLTHGGHRAMAAQYLDGGKLERLNSVILAQAGMTVGAAGYAIARRLGRQDLVDQLTDATPIID